jgi:hypothetical protein
MILYCGFEKYSFFVLKVKKNFPEFAAKSSFSGPKNENC